eukprot:516900_1
MGCLCSTAPKLDNKDDMLDDLPEDFSHKDTTNADFGTWLDKQPLWSKIVYPLICVLVSAVLIYIGYRIFHKSEDITLRGGLTEAEFKHYEDQKTQIDPEAGCHLFVLSHGLNDSPSGLAYLAKRLIHNLQRPSDSPPCGHNRIAVLNLDVNVGKTTEGIYSGGVRAKDEIAMYLSKNSCIKRVSAIGHSLGGMYLRVAFGELQGLDVMNGIQLVNYVSFASPHLGSLDFRGQFGTRLANFGVPFWAGQTGRELMLQDTNAPPLLWRMAEGKKMYLDALEAFAKRIAVANIANDTSVSFRSATMLRENFYKAYKSQFKSRLPALAYNSRIVDRAKVLADLGHTDRYYTENFPKANTKDDAWEQIMIGNLNTMDWIRVDCFGRPLFAHTDIVVKSERFNNGHKIVEHVISLLQV